MPFALSAVSVNLNILTCPSCLADLTEELQSQNLRKILISHKT